MKESKCLSCGQGLGEVERLEKCVAELEAQRVPNPGVVGTLQDKNTLLEYKDAQIARLQARVEELESAVANLRMICASLSVYKRLSDARRHELGAHAQRIAASVGLGGSILREGADKELDTQ